jgi:hypothetical protein
MFPAGFSAQTKSLWRLPLGQRVRLSKILVETYLLRGVTASPSLDCGGRSLKGGLELIFKDQYSQGKKGDIIDAWENIRTAN